MKILYAEDHESMRNTTLRLLERHDHIVEAVHDGRQLLEKFDPGKYDVVITDNRMPWKSGVQVLQEIRRRPGLEKYPIVVVSGDDDVAEVVQSLGGQFFLKAYMWPGLHIFLERLASRA